MYHLCAVCPSISLTIHLFNQLSVRQSVCDEDFPKSAILGAATQAYVCESDDVICTICVLSLHPSVIPSVCPSISLSIHLSDQLSFRQSVCDEVSPKRAILGAATQAYVCESDEETGTVCVSVCPSICLSISLSIHLSDYKSVRQSFCDKDSPKRAILGAATQANVCESDEETGTVCVSVCPSICPSISLSIHLSVHLSICQSVCDEDSPKRAIQGAATQAYVFESDNETGTVCLSIHLSIHQSVHPSV